MGVSPIDAEYTDARLIEAATTATAARYRSDWHVVGAALRLRTG